MRYQELFRYSHLENGAFESKNHLFNNMVLLISALV